MTALEWALQALLLALLLLALPFALRLERRLAELKREGRALATGAEDIAEAARAAETVLARLRAAVEGAGERVAAASRLRDDLSYLAERAEALADRLEEAVRAARPLAQPEAAPPRSRVERELLRALEGGGR